MSGILMPEIVIYNTLESIVRLLRKDLEEFSNEEQSSILYRILGVDENGNDIKLNLYNFFNQAKKIISTPGKISINLGYNQKVSQDISLHIILPSEQGESTIGTDEGYIEEDEIYNNKKIGVREYLTQSYKTNYQIMITSSNYSEVNVMYNVLKSMLLMLFPHLDLMGLRVPSLSGNDIYMQEDIVPVPVFHKVISLSFLYEHTVPKNLVNKIVKNFYFELKAIDYKESII